MERRRNKKARPLDARRLRDLALHYVGRYATTRAKLAVYLRRKLRERGWEDESDPDVEALAERFAELGYIDDAAYAETKASSLAARGYGARRVEQALRAAGIGDSDRQEAGHRDEEARWQAAERFAKRRRFGPYADTEPDRELREKQLAAFIRAGHDFEIAKRFLDAAPGEIVEPEI